MADISIMIRGFDPCHTWLGIAPKDEPPNFYQLLAIDLFESNVDVIGLAADRQMAHLWTFQTGPHGADSQRMLNEVAGDRVCLLNPQEKARYDAELKQPIASLPTQGAASEARRSQTRKALDHVYLASV